MYGLFLAKNLLITRTTIASVMYGLIHYSKPENPAMAYLRLNFSLPFSDMTCTLTPKLDLIT